MGSRRPEGFQKHRVLRKLGDILLYKDYTVDMIPSRFSEDPDADLLEVQPGDNDIDKSGNNLHGNVRELK